MNFWLRVEMADLGLIERAQFHPKLSDVVKTKYLIRKRDQTLVAWVERDWDGYVESHVGSEAADGRETIFCFFWAEAVESDERYEWAREEERRKEYRQRHFAHPISSWTPQTAPT